jgi:hypothetical protein
MTMPNSPDTLDARAANFTEGCACDRCCCAPDFARSEVHRALAQLRGEVGAMPTDSVRGELVVDWADVIDLIDEALGDPNAQ